MFSKSFIPSPLYVLQGALFLRKHPVLWKYASAPIIIGLVFISSAYILLYYTFHWFIGDFTPQEWYWQVLYYFAIVIAALVLVVLFFFFFTRVASALASPFNDLLSQKTEELIKGSYNDIPFSAIQLLKDSGRSIGHSFKLLGLYIVLLFSCLLLLLIPGVGGPLFSLASWLLSAYMFSYEYMGYPMDRRRYSWIAKRAFFRTRFRTVLGFGLGSLVAASIPFVNLLFIPSAAVGGTLLFLELESKEGRPMPKA